MNKKPKIEGRLPITFPDYDFAKEIAENINRDTPDIAIIADNMCWITAEYWINCKKYVRKYCQLKND